MRSYAEIEKKQIQEFLTTGWISHDAAWLSLCAAELGMDRTNALNRAAARQMARGEARRILRLLGVRVIENYEELQQFLLTGFELIRGSFMRFELDFPGENRMVWAVPRCFAHDGMKKMNLIHEYQCGIVERVLGWMEALQIPIRIEPHPVGCLMHEHGQCRMIVNFWAASGEVSETGTEAARKLE